MGSGDENSPVKALRETASNQETPNTPLYPDWSTQAQLQAYYGPGATPPFFTSPIASSPSPHPYLWGSQHLISPYGTPVPYPALYSHGGHYAHLNMAMSQGAPPATADMGGKAPTDRSSIKKSKGSSVNTGGKAVGSGKAASCSENDGPSHSDGSGSEGSSSGRDQSTNQQELSGSGKRSFNEMLADGANAQSTSMAQCRGPPIEPIFCARGQPAANVPASVTGNSAVTMPLTNLNIGMDLWNASSQGVPIKTRPNGSGVSPAVASASVVGREGFAAEHSWTQDERELKKQRRKQSNRESARRSRLRKQAECEELQSKVDILANENQALKDEMQRLAEECAKLTSENNSIMEELTRLYGSNTVAAHLRTTETEKVSNSTDGDREDDSVSCQKEGKIFSSNRKLDFCSN